MVSNPVSLFGWITTKFSPLSSSASTNSLAATELASGSVVTGWKIAMK